MEAYKSENCIEARVSMINGIFELKFVKILINDRNVELSRKSKRL